LRYQPYVFTEQGYGDVVGLMRHCKYGNLKIEGHELTARYHLDCDLPEYNSSAFRPPQSAGGQMRMF
jgi:hypothetical protein